MQGLAVSGNTKGYGMIAEAAMCMAMNIYHEARNESTIGQIAVAQVVMNRVNDDRFPNTVCGVVEQGIYYRGKPVKHKCQFSWFCDGLPDTPKNEEAFEEAMDIGVMVMGGHFTSMFDGITHYHADYVSPLWRQHKTFVVKINSHIFYRWD
jgi:N-acetylmuramoyl-L-alanine amidase